MPPAHDRRMSIVSRKIADLCLQKALERNAATLILWHNPSSVAEPAQATCS